MHIPADNASQPWVPVTLPSPGPRLISLSSKDEGRPCGAKTRQYLLSISMCQDFTCIIATQGLSVKQIWTAELTGCINRKIHTCGQQHYTHPGQPRRLPAITNAISHQPTLTFHLGYFQRQCGFACGVPPTSHLHQQLWRGKSKGASAHFLQMCCLDTAVGSGYAASAPRMPRHPDWALPVTASQLGITDTT